MSDARTPALPQPSRLPPASITLALAAALQLWWWPLYTPDLTVFLLPWFDHIVQAGPIGAFASPFSNYTPPYLYLLAALTELRAIAAPAELIKALSLGGLALLALAMWRLFVALGVAQAHRAAVLVLLLPSVALNGGFMAQCDAFWSAACVMALAAAINRRHAAMLAWCGVAIAFKAQAAFGAPFFLALLIARRVPLRLWLVAPATAAAMMLPAWAAGWPAGHLATIYLRQAEQIDGLSLNAPNLWAFFEGTPAGWAGPLTVVGLAAAACAAAAYVAWLALHLPERHPGLLQAALLAPLLTVGLLPRMHERYFFFADLVAVALAITVRNRASIGIAVCVQAGSALGLLAYLSGITGFAALGAVAMLVASWKLGAALLGSAQSGAAAADSKLHAAAPMLLRPVGMARTGSGDVQ